MKDKEFNKIFYLAKNNNRKAQNDLIHIFEPLILKKSIVNGKFNEDCFQELCIKLFECISNFSYNSRIDILSYFNINPDSKRKI